MSGRIRSALAAAVVLLSTSRLPLRLSGSQIVEPWLLGQYEGTLACADCSGIQTVVTLYARSRTETGDGMFLLRETWLGAADPERTRVVQGRWTTLRGNATDPDATIYQLTPNPPGHVLYFLRVGESELRVLDREQREIASDVPHTLRRVEAAAPIGGYSMVAPSNAEVAAAATFAIREYAARSGRTIVLRAVLRAERQIVAGVNYRLCLDLTIDGRRENAIAVVYQDLRQQFSLAQWDSGSCR
jgi:uncharacterized lipoprotein NlpE involved in copper resistance